MATTASDILDRLGPILSEAPALGSDLRQFASRIADPAQGPAGPWIWQSLGALAAALAAFLLIPAWVERLCRRISRSDRQGPQMVSTLIGDLCGVAVQIGVFSAAKTLWFVDDSARAALTVSLLAGFVHWRLTMLPVDVLLRHRLPGARLIEAGDVHAAEMHRLAAWLLAFVAFSRALLRAFLRANMPIPAVQFMALGVGLIDGGLAVYLLGRLHRTLRATPTASALGTSRASRASQLWYPVALVYVLALTLAWLWGVIVVDLTVTWALVTTGGVVLGALVLHSILKVSLLRAAGQNARSGDTNRTARWHRLVRHCFGVLLWLAAAVLIAQIWIEPLSQVLPLAEWEALRRPVVSAAVTMYIAYVLWHVVSIHTETAPLASGPLQSDENGGIPPIATRLQTMLPVLRIFVLVSIATVAALIALSDLGVNTTSLIAGASIFGLAISFGSQSLVHDIVSGIFFMADDAFRIGEYIDTGKAKGTVESMSVRSLRLRHQNGQIHVIPFGQIQQVTNYSRDWTTVKFNLRLNINTDIDKVRKTVKQIGAEMMQDPEFAPELLQPLKMQGVSEIDPVGLTVRLKFTALPGQPTLLQREALKRITKAFREKGIEFASSNVMIQTVTVPASAEDVPKPAAAPAGAAEAQVSEIPRPTRNVAGA
ncbi:MAG: mechanosensitive ion channel [Alphaproteobacteria bacterium]|nr:mechanosensitive ion channel [Alphaproteobacteria bacterium]